MLCIFITKHKIKQKIISRAKKREVMFTTWAGERNNFNQAIITITLYKY